MPAPAQRTRAGLRAAGCGPAELRPQVAPCAHVQGVDGKAAGKEASGKDDKAVRLKPEGKASGKAPAAAAAADVEAWHDKNAVKRLQAVRLRGALLDAGVS